MVPHGSGICTQPSPGKLEKLAANESEVAFIIEWRLREKGMSMAHVRGYRGWMAAVTAGVMIALLLLVFAKHFDAPRPVERRAPNTSSVRAVSTEPQQPGKTTDPGFARIELLPEGNALPLVRRDDAPRQSQRSQVTLRQPPEPASNVVLRAPIGQDGFAPLPLHDSPSTLAGLMDSMDDALNLPVMVVSNRSEVAEQDEGFTQRTNSPEASAPRIPEPRKLLAELAELESLLRNRGDRQSQLIASAPGAYSAPVSAAEARNVQMWIGSVRNVLNDLISNHGLERPESLRETAALAKLSEDARVLGESLSNYALAQNLLTTAYSLQRRVDVYRAIQGCLDRTSIGLDRAKSSDLTRAELRQAILNVQAKLPETGDEAAWADYLLIDRLTAWVDSPKNIWAEGNGLALAALSRLRWERLGDIQNEFLSQPEFVALARHLEAWSRDPVDYRQLLTDIEELEVSPVKQDSESIAGAVQVLRTSPELNQQVLAQALNNHYRNANIRLSISRTLIQRFMPEEAVEVRPVRRSILGARTQGNSKIATELDVQLTPDDSAWNISLGVLGDLYSQTASEKGPATFHNTSIAQINSRRYLRLDPMGYRISSEPTNVRSQDYLRHMETDFDGLPVIGDFVRLIVREQFDQKRGIVRRVSQRMIADEADEELDRRLNEAMEKASKELEQRITGPLHKLQLDPMVVSMSTSEQRLGIRYRVASGSQMASHTPRPRAPGDSLLSMQVHQSTVNNAIESMGLGKKPWKLDQLCEKLGVAFGQSGWKLPDEAPDDITIDFASNRPAYIEMEEGRLRLTLRINSLSNKDGLSLGPLIVTSSYIPLAEGLSAELIRDGILEIKTPRGTLIRHKALLRGIFAKVFVSRPKIPLIAESWREDPRAEGLAVSQLEIRDNWLSVAISPADSSHAKAVANRSREIKQLY